MPARITDGADAVYGGRYGVRVVIDKDSAPLLSEATIDFKDSLERSGFAIENPLGGGGCTCGH